MSVETYIYDDKFFANSLALEGTSAQAVAQILYTHFQPRAVVDIGCGSGIFLREFEKLGVSILGVDGAPAAVINSLVGDKIILHDLCEPLVLEKKFDLCLCFEVAEHLPKNASDTLVKSLVQLADTIIFTAATPGQGPRSIGHINEQEQAYWINKFAACNFRLEQKLTDAMRQEFEQENVVWWLIKNLMVFGKIPVTNPC
jgi:2-polyprenyl-3-methyl-5-hydroxy-6-metoxy-1,4-benzoquinol methylase